MTTQQWEPPNDGARRQIWRCEDGFRVAYTTTRRAGHRRNYAAELIAPDGHQVVQQFTTRRYEAKEVADMWYRKHSPSYREQAYPEWLTSRINGQYRKALIIEEEDDLS
jgi:hypothetical protein